MAEAQALPAGEELTGESGQYDARTHVLRLTELLARRIEQHQTLQGIARKYLTGEDLTSDEATVLCTATLRCKMRARRVFF